MSGERTTQATLASVADDLDALRTALPTDDAELALPLARLLAACSGTLRAEVGQPVNAPSHRPGEE